MLGQVEQADVEGAHKQAVSLPFSLPFNYFIIHYRTRLFYLCVCVPYHLCFAGQGVLLD